MTKFIVIRHCSATGQAPDAPLTPEGFQQAQQLATFLQPYNIYKIICSPYTRTLQTITPFATSENIQIETDERLKERVLSTENLPDWFEKLQQSFENPDIKLAGGETGNEASARIIAVMNELQSAEDEVIALVTHGNLTALLLNSISQNFGFEQWQQLRNPDVYVIDTDASEWRYERVWG